MVLDKVKAYLTYPIEFGKRAANYKRVEQNVPVEFHEIADADFSAYTTHAAVGGAIESLMYSFGAGCFINPNLTIPALLGTLAVRGGEFGISCVYYKIKGRNYSKKVSEHHSLPLK